MSNISSRDYFVEVNEVAQSIFDEVMIDNDNDFETCESDGLFYDRLHETVDSHEWVIYSRYNVQVLQHATNPEYMIDELGKEAAGEALEVGGLVGLHTALAFWALCNDVQSKLSEVMDDYEPEEEEE